METEPLITKITQILHRDDGSEVKIIAKAATGLGLTQSTDIQVYKRETSLHEWRLCNDRPHPEWRTMSVDDYLNHGRPEMLNVATAGEILKVASSIGKPYKS